MKTERYCPAPTLHMIGFWHMHNERVVLTQRERTTLTTAAKLVEQARDVMRERVGELEFGAHPAFTLTVDRLLDGEADWLEPDKGDQHEITYVRTVWTGLRLGIEGHVLCDGGP